MWYSSCMPQGTFELDRASEAHCSHVAEPEIFFPRTATDLRERRWESYCSGCPIKDLCGKAVYDGFTGIAGGEFHGKLAREPEPIRKKPRKAHKVSRPEVPRLNAALGTVIRQERLAQGMTLRDFSAKVYLSISMISEFERGLVETSSESVAKIAEALGVAQSALVRSAAEQIAKLEFSSGRGATSSA